MAGTDIITQQWEGQGIREQYQIYVMQILFVTDSFIWELRLLSKPEVIACITDLGL
jgi:hypothetical protein